MDEKLSAFERILNASATNDVLEFGCQAACILFESGFISEAQYRILMAE